MILYDTDRKTLSATPAHRSRVYGIPILFPYNVLAKGTNMKKKHGYEADIRNAYGNVQICSSTMTFTLIRAHCISYLIWFCVFEACVQPEV